MKVFGSISELFNLVFRKSGFQVTVQPSTASADTAFQLPGAGGGTKAIITADATQTLTNKTISDGILIGASTTIQDGAAIVDTADATKRLQFDVGGTAGTFMQINTAQTANRAITLPDATTTLVGTDTAQTLTNKTLTTPTLQSPTSTGGSYTGVVTLSLDDADSAFNTVVRSSSTNTSDRTLTLDVDNGSRTLELSGDLRLLGNNDTSLTTSAATAVTLPTTGTLATLAGSETLTNKDIDGGTASDSPFRRITLPKAATAALNALARKEATLVYDTSTGQVKFDNGASLSALTSTATATSTAQGTVTSFAPLVMTSFNTVTDAAYTVLDADGYDAIYMNITTGTGRIITLPTASDNDGRRLLVKKTGAGTGTVTVDGEGAETVDGAATFILYTQNDWVEIKCDGTNWQIAGHFRRPDTIQARNTSSQSFGPWVAPATQDITMATENIDLGGDWSSTTWTCRVPGYYRVVLQTSILKSAGTAVQGDAVNLYIYKNGSPYGNHQIIEMGDLSWHGACISEIVLMATGDTIKGVLSYNATVPNSMTGSAFVPQISISGVNF